MDYHYPVTSNRNIDDRVTQDAILTKARSILSESGGVRWTRSTVARDLGGRKCSTRSVKAKRFCLMGACIYAARQTLPRVKSKTDRAIIDLLEPIWDRMQQYLPACCSLPVYNDEIAVHSDDVVGLIERTLEPEEAVQ